jgi:hypothetical protein
VTSATAGVPVELKTPATLAIQRALATYAHFTGIPGYNYYTLLPTAVNFRDFGQPANPQCGYSTILQGTQFVVTNNGKPTCTSILP